LQGAREVLAVAVTTADSAAAGVAEVMEEEEEAAIRAAAVPLTLEAVAAGRIWGLLW